ncbi:hypothetical protein HYH03_008648 [Edaphochlamys debaryana]|uniref:Coenzyme Q-binding protein COQ10 START domain-containing protein n=1 Tax=Edaphochlamys debaryana TaxID=47281 RepID=A0A835XY46_9CHLO|nr:hypothetical protein HYH03_008648 [Edaphochlamys debaryana]|eukprot:KAG2493232.1 hypothetical protein HYH03_008648 [Edaphochlamys debaryana]
MNALQASHSASYSGRPLERPTRLARTRLQQRVHCSAAVRPVAAAGVRIDVEKTSWNSRRIFASVSVATPKQSVWSALTDYDGLQKFIPSLVENRCLERSAYGAVLYQVGAQDVAMGVKFSAAVTLRCTEFQNGGLPESAMTRPPPGSPSASSAASAGSSMDQGGATSNGGSASSTMSAGGTGWSSGEPAASIESLYPFPATSAPGVRASDITFEMLEGDFQVFRGVWRMQQLSERLTLLSYALYVKPQAWLPVALIQGRIENEVVRNLEAVSRYAESRFQAQQAAGAGAQAQAQQAAGAGAQAQAQQAQRK